MTDQTSSKPQKIPVIGWRLLDNGDTVVSITSEDPHFEGHFTVDQAGQLAAHFASGAERAKSVKAVNAWIERNLPDITAEQKIAMIEDLMKMTDKDDLRTALAPLFSGFGL